jgi:polyphosphate kinase
MNALVDSDIIEALYAASVAGVPIELLVRGICCLRPGLPGVSENIRVYSIVDQFLEHSRIYYFENDGNPEIYLGSADWMPRNLVRRVEVVFPILDPKIRRRMTDEIIATFRSDTVKARELHGDGTTTRRAPQPGVPPLRCQAEFIRIAEKAAKPTAPKTQ